MLSDLYAMGVENCDNMLMLLGVSTKMSEKERDTVVPLMMRGFKVPQTALINPRQTSVGGSGVRNYLPMQRKKTIELESYNKFRLWWTRWAALERGGHVQLADFIV